MDKKTQRIYNMTYASVYPLYLAKIERKGQEESDLIDIISWLTGYSKEDLESLQQSDITFENFFNEAPLMNPNTHLITGSICGVKVQEVEDPIIQKIRFLDKIVDELAKGKAVEKIKRVP